MQRGFELYECPLVLCQFLIVKMARRYLMSVCFIISASCHRDRLTAHHHCSDVTTLPCDNINTIYNEFSCRPLAAWPPGSPMFVNEIYFNNVIGSIRSRCDCDPYSHGKHETTTAKKGGSLVLREREREAIVSPVSTNTPAVRRWSDFLCLRPSGRTLKHCSRHVHVASSSET